MGHGVVHQHVLHAQETQHLRRGDRARVASSPPATQAQALAAADRRQDKAASAQVRTQARQRPHRVAKLCVHTRRGAPVLRGRPRHALLGQGRPASAHPTGVAIQELLQARAVGARGSREPRRRRHQPSPHRRDHPALHSTGHGRAGRQHRLPQHQGRVRYPDLLISWCRTKRATCNKKCTYLGKQFASPPVIVLGT